MPIHKSKLSSQSVYLFLSCKVRNYFRAGKLCLGNTVSILALLWGEEVDFCAFFAHVHCFKPFFLAPSQGVSNSVQSRENELGPKTLIHEKKSFLSYLWSSWAQMWCQEGCASSSLRDLRQVTNLCELQFAYQLNGDNKITSLIGFHRSCLLKSAQKMPVAILLGPVGLRHHASICPVHSHPSQPKSLPFFFPKNYLTCSFWSLLLFLMDHFLFGKGDFELHLFSPVC